MNIYLLHVGYVIGVLAVTCAITFLLDYCIFNELLADAKSAAPALSFMALVATALLLLSYY